jgi:mRNA-degrading endonuclease YafQ of YafQ-DinJ toxin-antitoxin module
MLRTVRINVPKTDEKFKIIASTLLEGKQLDPLHRDHQLIGNYTGRREVT